MPAEVVAVLIESREASQALAHLDRIVGDLLWADVHEGAEEAAQDHHPDHLAHGRPAEVEDAELAAIRGHQHIVESMTFSHDGRRVLSWDRGDTARVWDTESGEQLLLLQHEHRVNGAEWNGDESRILTWSWDNTARVWDAESGTELLSLEHDDWVNGAVFSPDGGEIGT